METMNTQLAFTQQKPIFMRMASIADYSSMNTEQQRIYMDSLNNYRTVMAAKEYDFSRGKKEGRVEGRAEGLAEGRAEGLAEGKAEGLAEGEHKRQLSIAFNMKAKGFTAEMIQELTGVTTAEIDKM